MIDLISGNKMEILRGRQVSQILLFLQFASLLIISDQSANSIFTALNVERRRSGQGLSSFSKLFVKR